MFVFMAVPAVPPLQFRNMSPLGSANPSARLIRFVALGRQRSELWAKEVKDSAEAKSTARQRVERLSSAAKREMVPIRIILI
jgi:hypothetical protein